MGQIAIEEGCDWLTADFNCTVTDPAYVSEILDRLQADEPRIFGCCSTSSSRSLRPGEHRIDVTKRERRKPLFLDESAHDWRFVRLGRELGWTGVALKTCKTLTGALLSLCWARTTHGPDGAGSDEPDARPDPARPAGRARRHDHGRRVQCDAVLSRGERA